jgi:hypothetical protein
VVNKFIAHKKIKKFLSSDLVSFLNDLRYIEKLNLFIKIDIVNLLVDAFLILVIVKVLAPSSPCNFYRKFLDIYSIK